MDIGGGDDGVKHQTLRVDEKVPYLAFELLAHVIAVRIDVNAAVFCAFVTLCAHDRRRCARSWHRSCTDDTDKEAVDAARASVVAPAQRSEAAIRKQTTGVTSDGLPVHSFRTPLADLATLTRNTVVTFIAPALPLTALARPLPVQCCACELLDVAL